MKLLIATKNPGKLKEMQSFLGDDFELVSLADFPDAPDVHETGPTFYENAVLKAKAYFQWSGIASVADDGGLEIYALGGEPGVYSRRWPTPEEHASGQMREKTDDELIDLALTKLHGVADRFAQLRVVGAYYDGAHTLTAAGCIDGTIVTERPLSCEKGYPFRSIFLVPKFGKLFKDLTAQEHEAVNHRRAVYNQLRELILAKVSV